MRRLFVLAGACVALVALSVVLFPVALAWPTLRWRNRVSVLFGRLWSRFVLRLAGIRLHVRGAEHLVGPAVLTFNHTNELDFLVNAAVAPPPILVFGKRELVAVPLLGWMWWLGGHPLIRRKDRNHWQGELDRVERLIREQGMSTFVAPEGTRNRTGRLLPFKKGPFHTAIQTGAPIVPIVIVGAEQRLDERGRLHPGPIELRALPPIDTRGWRVEDVDLHAERVRRLYLEALGQQDDAPPREAAVGATAAHEAG